jgi:hypothetical protein
VILHTIKVRNFNRFIVRTSRSCVRNIIHHHLSQGKHSIKIMVKPCQFGDRSKMQMHAIVAYSHLQYKCLTSYGVGLVLELLEKLILVQPVKHCNYS